MTEPTQKSYDEYRQGLIDDGTCHLCGGCARCEDRYNKLAAALQEILDMDSCLLADAREIARKALD